jgi:hypothetical protein
MWVHGPHNGPFWLFDPCRQRRDAETTICGECGNSPTGSGTAPAVLRYGMCKQCRQLAFKEMRHRHHRMRKLCVKARKAFEVWPGSGRLVELHHRSATRYQIHQHIR